MQKITPFLWFNKEAEEAANLYVDVFSKYAKGETKILEVQRYPADTPSGKTGEVMVANFVLNGQEFNALNGGPEFKFNESISFVINCDNQEEVDYFWNSLIADGGEESVCGWLKDKFGLSWQVVPIQLGQMMGDPDPEKARRVTEAMLKMKKIDISELEKARDQQ